MISTWMREVLFHTQPYFVEFTKVILHLLNVPSLLSRWWTLQHLSQRFTSPCCIQSNIAVSSDWTWEILRTFKASTFPTSLCRLYTFSLTPQAQMAFRTPFFVLGLNEKHYYGVMWLFLFKLLHQKSRPWVLSGSKIGYHHVNSFLNRLKWIKKEIHL